MQKSSIRGWFPMVKLRNIILGFLSNNNNCFTRSKNHSLTSIPQTPWSMSLPEDLIMEILSWLPVKTLLRFKSASKSFLSLIISPEFVKLHLGRSLNRNSSVTLLYSSGAFLASCDFNHPQRPIVQLDIHPGVKNLLKPYRYENSLYLYSPMITGICNGVVCFHKAKEFVLYNPATRAYRQIPRLKMRESCHRLTHNGEWSCTIMFNEEFVYDCNGDDFKIFSSVHYCKAPDQNDFEFYIYSLKDNSWLKIESLGVDPSRRTHIANNSLYWVTLKDSLQTKAIMRFDLSNHRYEEMSTPREINPAHILTVRVLNGRPHVLIIHGFHFEIWMITDDNCWTPLFRCSTKQYGWEYENDLPYCKHFIRPYLGYANSRDGRKILIEPLKNSKCFYCCDLESQTISQVQPVGLPEDSRAFAWSWAESLVPLE